MNKNLHVVVLMGGWSAEREISLRSGKACADALERIGFRVTRINVDRDVAAALTAAKPDVALNLLGYVPFGFLCIAALQPRLRGASAFIAALACGFALSLVLEAAQSYLPARFAMNVDLLCNTLGATAGAALGVLFAPGLEGPTARLRAPMERRRDPPRPRCPSRRPRRLGRS